MSILNNSLLLGAPAGAVGYTISRSLRFNSADSSFLSRTPGSAGNRKTWTWAGWVKRSDVSSVQGVFSSSTGAIEFYGTYINITETSGFSVNTSAVFRDPSAWYHFVFTLDTTQATASDRLKIYQNGVRLTDFFSTTWPNQNTDYGINSTTLHTIGESRALGRYFSGYLADIHFIDGQALTPTSFGEFSATTGVWVPKAYTGSYGTNGFKLDFADNSAATAAALGKDTSGNGNNFTPNNLSVSAGAGNDSLVDVPTTSGTDNGNGGEIRGNYATLNPLKNNSNNALSNGNLTVINSASSTSLSFATIALPKSGKYYFEALASANGGTTAIQIGIFSTDHALTQSGSKRYWYLESGAILEDNTDLQTGVGSYTAGDVIGCAYNADANTVTWYRNGVQRGNAVSVNTSYDYVFGLGIYKGQWDANFGQRPFAYPVSGFKALCTANLPAPLVTKPSDVFDVVTYTGTGSNPRTLSGLAFSPDFVWIKDRSQGNWHRLNDTVRGSNKTLFSNDTAAELANDANGYLSAFTSDGFTVTNGATSADGVNKLNNAYVAWNWDAGSTTVTNTAGSITSSVRANATAGFSIVTYTGNGVSNATIGHGLGVAPRLIFVKARSAAQPWIALTTAIDGSQDYGLLNTTDAFANDTVNATPTSTVFTVSSGPAVNGNTTTYVAYCFAPVNSYSAFGSYQGNSSADGPFVFCNFRPRWVLMKRTNTVSNWFLHDSARSTYNVANHILFANLSSAEDSSQAYIDFLSNGFKPRFTNTDYNTSGSTYVWAAFAESPFQYARAR